MVGEVTTDLGDDLWSNELIKHNSLLIDLDVLDI